METLPNKPCKAVRLRLSDNRTIMLWPACITASLLLWSRQAVFAQPMVVPAALKVYSDAAAPRCEVSYLVLPAAMDASCEQQCQLTLAETHTPSEGLHNTEDAAGRSNCCQATLSACHVQSRPGHHICCKCCVTQAATAGHTLLHCTTRRIS